ncbi:hypothetical protein Leryth_026716 [Lithospermum erythrorhizon]|nr:hypothetical protein Leryth_026716 [Lithospermum erythrorhizon]
MRIFKWESDFSPVKESAIAPVWIRIEGVPLYLFDKMSLLSIANAIGHPLSVHPLNVSRVKLNSAIICVELDVNKILMDSIYVCFEDDCSLRPVEGFWLKVYYDVIPPYCISCLHIGHLVDVCKKGLSENGAGFTPFVIMEEKNRTAPKVLDVLPQHNKPPFSARSSSSFAAGIRNNHGRKVKYTQVWRENKDTGDLKSRRQVLNSKGKELLTENSFGPLELIAADIVVVASDLELTDSTTVELRERSKLDVQADGSENLVAPLMGRLESVTGLEEEAPVVPAPDAAKPDLV